ncbi:MAG: FAD-dependent oxidoreductase [candidate division NC10 bacterium]|nr:FAD-dependent oxidoreductase [candidate division NC10 bacterium]
MDLPKIVARKDAIVRRFRSGHEHKVDSREHLHLYRGHARFLGPHQVAVGEHILESQRIFINTGTRPEIPRIQGLENGQIALSLEASDRSQTLAGSHLLVATGRRPNTDDMGLDKAGLETDKRGFVKVNSRLETNVPGIWALGNVKGGPAFTHISYDDYQIVYGNLVEGKGLTIENRILGAAILATEGGELIQALSSFILTGAPYTILKGAIYIHPTLAEGFFSLMDE